MDEHQTSHAALSRLLTSYEDRFEAAEHLPPAPELVVTGAEVHQSARGAALLSPHSAEVTLEWKGLGEGPHLFEHSPARLVKDGRGYREDMLGAPKSLHEIRGGRVTLAPEGSRLAVLPPRPGTLPAPTSAEIPPAATEIDGAGLVRYRTGHVIEVDGPRLLPRPAASGALEIRPGGVYATYEGRFPATVRLGTTWIPLQP